MADDQRPWYEIVGVVSELGMGAPTQHGRAAGLYLPSAPGSNGPVNMMVHVQGDPLSFGPRLRSVAMTVDPSLRLSDIQRVDQITSGILWIIGMWLRITFVLTGIALLLSLTGIYSVLSFTVARRTREIGVRVALGANPRRVVTAIFRRPLTQVSLGVAAGGAVIGLVAFLVSNVGLEDGSFRPAFTAGQAGLLVGYAAFMLAVCLLACIVPTWRALRVEPTEALRSE
jgi:ABC-type antimicrobial peptide transport system permease subunit